MSLLNNIGLSGAVSLAAHEAMCMPHELACISTVEILSETISSEFNTPNVLVKGWIWRAIEREANAIRSEIR